MIIPFAAARSVSRIASEKSPLKAARWQKIAREAARCCRSAQITDVLPVASFETMLARACKQALKMIFWEEEDQKNIKDILSNQTWAAAKDIFIIVGPEGGFFKDEILKAKEALGEVRMAVYKFAGFWRRLVAYIVDNIIINIVFFI